MKNGIRIYWTARGPIQGIFPIPHPLWGAEEGPAAGAAPFMLCLWITGESLGIPLCWRMSFGAENAMMQDLASITGAPRLVPLLRMGQLLPSGKKIGSR